MASRYDRAVGYFRSSVLLITGSAIVEFAQRGGTIRLIASPSLTAEDIEALTAAYSTREIVAEQALLRDVESLLATVPLRQPSEALATLVSLGIVDVRIALREDGRGIYHEKLGLFRDPFDNGVSFRGSSNETWAAWHLEGNVESFEVFTTWSNAADAARVRKHEEYFERLWAGFTPGVSVMPFPEAARRKLCTIAKPSLDELTERPIRRIDSGREPLPHQRDAINAWTVAGYRGILEHATGSGKTYSATMAIRTHAADGGASLVLVPSVILLNQWFTELRRELPDAAILRAGGGNNTWRQAGHLRSFAAHLENTAPRIVLATMRTASTSDFIAQLGTPQELLVIADEVHQTGSTENRQLFAIDAKKRLGLSATPQRAGDDIGTAALFAYFGPVIQPPFTLRDAIAAGRLVHYEYHPHFAEMTHDELSAWLAITSDLNREIARASKPGQHSPTVSERAKLLLIQRSRIVKKASRKVQLAKQVIADTYEPGQRWLVYCEDLSQLNEVRDGLRAMDLEVHEYHSAMTGDRAGTLRWLTDFGGILVSIRCLDEGVDIPEVSHALILASSQNPRQFIQRRGRVLRTAPGKTLAWVHDALVVPPQGEEAGSSMSFARSEIARALQFADSAINPTAAAVLRERAMLLGIDLEGLVDQDFEEDSDAA
jgi:superfamily II DNA or RNA helicase